MQGFGVVQCESERDATIVRMPDEMERRPVGGYFPNGYSTDLDLSYTVII
jgi:hypothetical protein